MTNIVEKIQSEITQDYYKQNFPNDGQRFVAWYLRNIYLLDQLQAKDAITDGANDKQIDAVYIDEDEQKIHIIQGKFYTGDTVNAEPIREVISAWSQFDHLDKLQDNANEKLKKKICEISTALEDETYCLCFELITTSTFSEDANRDIEAFQSKLAETDDDCFNAQFEVVDKQGIEDKYNMVLEQVNPSLNHTVVLERGKYLMTDLSNTKVLLAAVSLKECIKMPGIKDGSLFQKNVRQSLGINNTVNKKIKKTLSDPAKCRDFFFFHNGITAICNKMEVVADGQFKFYGLNVVNGCQSLNTIISCSETVKKRDDAYVLIRFYEIPQRDRADSISINTNTQSAVKARDLRSNSKQVLKLKKAYEQKYPTGFFATKRGETIPADKDKNYAVELSLLGKQATAWYMQRPNLSYGETKIFDKYFSTLFKVEYLPEDIYALKFWYNKIMEAWNEHNPYGINDTILTMKAYAPYHILYAISAIFAKSNNQDNVPSPSQCLEIANLHDGYIDTIISMAVSCLNNALETEDAKCKSDNRTFIPQNWIKSKTSLNGIQSAIINMFSFSSDARKMKTELVMDPQYFSYRVKAADD
ncbi:MAG: AIPR family protein [Bacteroidales bacterium]|nr:AIPR family protein [Bacteroidales bacterium]